MGVCLQPDTEIVTKIEITVISLLHYILCYVLEWINGLLKKALFIAVPFYIAFLMVLCVILHIPEFRKKYVFSTLS